MSHLRLILDRPREGAVQMAIDRLLFEDSIERKSEHVTCRFYRFSPPVMTIGYSLGQSKLFQTNHSVPVVQRPTGGGAVYHGEDLIYALIIPVTVLKVFGRVKESYRLIRMMLQKTLQSFEISTQLFNRAEHIGLSSYCFDSPVEFDLMMGEQKVAGAGQKRTRSHLLHQGSIAWKLLPQTSAPVSEESFARAMAFQLADGFGFSVKEIPLDTEEQRRVELFVDGYARTSV